MAISQINAGAAAATTITIPSGHRAGDWLFMGAFNAVSTTLPTVPAGWTSIASGAGTLCSLLIARRLAASASETSGTWTTATHLACNVLRNVATNFAAPFQTPSQQTGTGTSVSYSGFAPMKRPGTSFILFFAGMSTSDTALETPPTGMTFRAGISSGGEIACFDSNDAAQSYASNSVSVGGTSGNWITRPLEVYAEQMNINNYMFVDVPNGMSTVEKLR